MLKITLHDSARELRFKLEGKLSGLWVQELKQSWKTAASTTEGRSTVVDLTDVDFVDDEGESLLTSMHQEGVRLIADTPMIRAMVDEVCGRQRCATVEGKLRPHALLRAQTSGSDPSAL
jgi:anti-anti-sigma regulatory factor